MILFHFIINLFFNFIDILLILLYHWNWFEFNWLFNELILFYFLFFEIYKMLKCAISVECQVRPAGQPACRGPCLCAARGPDFSFWFDLMFFFFCFLFIAAARIPLCCGRSFPSEFTPSWASVFLPLFCAFFFFDFSLCRFNSTLIIIVCAVVAFLGLKSR